ncbi:MAG: hypothetical protein D6741_16760 [Planctomycetota bacterium]|nr:MAG: hypothetical protein D6741_16760 [Planctomycetota bacterium]
MNAQDRDILHRLFHIAHGTLPMYLADTSPWVPHRLEELEEAFAEIVAEQRRFAERLTDVLDRVDVVPVSQPVPRIYTSLHDVAVDYLARLALQRHQEEIRQIEACRSEATSPALRELIDEMLESWRRQEQTLRECLQRFVRDESSTSAAR